MQYRHLSILILFCSVNFLDKTTICMGRSHSIDESLANMNLFSLFRNFVLIPQRSDKAQGKEY